MVEYQTYTDSKSSNLVKLRRRRWRLTVNGTSSISPLEYFRCFSSPEFVKKYGCEIQEDGRAECLTKVTIDTNSIGKIILTSILYEDIEKVIPILLLSVKQVLMIKKMGITSRVMRRRHPHKGAKYLCFPSETDFIKITTGWRLKAWQDLHIWRSFLWINLLEVVFGCLVVRFQLDRFLEGDLSLIFFV